MDMKKSYCSQQQKEKLVEFLMEDKLLSSGKFSPKFTFKDARVKWEDISNSLNSIPGAKKDWRQWRKTWQDLRSKAKSKTIQLKKYSTGTGRGPLSSDTLTEIDQKILSGISQCEVVGSQTVPETNIEFSFENVENMEQEVVISKSSVAEENETQWERYIQEHSYTVDEKENPGPTTSSYQKLKDIKVTEPLLVSF